MRVGAYLGRQRRISGGCFELKRVGGGLADLV